ncbi:hypothetical protein ACFY7H_24830 [Streptomyces sp. NPDC012794]|uniref:hypothetical protein n=1 Tax=Streptomyces sp. NPDC012794 TaxID=3364850 RepID=UPI0036A8AAE8
MTHKAHTITKTHTVTSAGAPPRKPARRLRGLPGISAGATLLVVVAAGAAQASPAAYRGCDYPYVCLYQGETETGRYKDVTADWQVLHASRGAAYLVNTRRDDTVLMHFTNGRVICVPPLANPASPLMYGTIDKIKIRSTSRC